MCIAIPGPFGATGPRSAFGRFIRAQPASMGAAAGALICLMALAGFLVSPGRGYPWPSVLLVQGISTLLLDALLARVPTHCAVSALGYPGHWLLAMGLGGGALLVGAGGLAMVTIGPWIGGDVVVAAGGLLALIAWVVLGLGLRETGRVPVLG